MRLPIPHQNVLTKGALYCQANVEAAGQACTACEAAISILYEKVMRHWLPHDWAGAEWWVQVRYHQPYQPRTKIPDHACMCICVQLYTLACLYPNIHRLHSLPAYCCLSTDGDMVSLCLTYGDGVAWQVYERGKGLAFHFDKDEHLFKEERRMVHPLLSSILYLTGSTFPKRLGDQYSLCVQMEFPALSRPHLGLPVFSKTLVTCYLVAPSRNSMLVISSIFVSLLILTCNSSALKSPWNSSPTLTCTLYYSDLTLACNLKPLL